VAAKTVALFAKPRQRVDRSLTQPGRERVKLYDVLPGGEVRVFAIREHAPIGLQESSGIGLEVGSRSVDEVFGMLQRPLVVGGDVVGHVVEDQPDSTCGQSRPS